MAPHENEFDTLVVNSVGKIAQSMCRRMKLDHFLTPHTSVNSKWIKDLNLRPKAIKILEENIASKILDIARSSIFSDISPQSRELKEKNKQMGLHQNKKVLHSKGEHQQNKRTIH